MVKERQRKDSIILVGFPASGKSTCLGRLLRQPAYRNHQTCYYDQTKKPEKRFLYSNGKARAAVSQKPFIMHWSFWTNSDMVQHIQDLTALVARIKEVRLLICPYNEFIARCEQRRRKRNVKHRVDTLERTIDRHKMLLKACDDLDLVVRIVDTSGKSLLNGSAEEILKHDLVTSEKE